MELDKIFEDNNVIKRGHFILSSKRHSDIYINKNMITTSAELFNIVILKLMIKALDFRKYNLITGPATAGAILASAMAIMQNKAFVYPEKEFQADGKFIMKFNRGYNKVIKNEKILLIEDIITTGNGVQQTINAIEKDGGDLVGVISIWNRTGWNPFGYKCKSLIDIFVDSWEEKECPMCKQNIPLTNPKD